MHSQRNFRILISLIATTILSSTVLPVVVPPFGSYPARQIIEVLLWQMIATIGWPFAIFGAVIAVLSGSTASLPSFLLPLLYPIILALVMKVFIWKDPRAWEVALLHLFLVASFVAIWYHVRNGYDVMLG